MVVLYREYKEVVGEEDNIIEAILILYTVSATRYLVGNIIMLVFNLKSSTNPVNILIVEIFPNREFLLNI